MSYIIVCIAPSVCFHTTPMYYALPPAFCFYAQRAPKQHPRRSRRAFCVCVERGHKRLPLHSRRAGNIHSGTAKFLSYLQLLSIRVPPSSSEEGSAHAPRNGSPRPPQGAAHTPRSGSPRPSRESVLGQSTRLYRPEDCERTSS